MKHELEKFIADNKEALLLLGEELKSCNKLTEPKYSEYSNESRLLAITIVSNWLTSIFGIIRPEDIIHEGSEENIFRRIQEDISEVSDI